jgi:GntR family transcriptional repressor for pyruvate dehydrogenase complex
MSSVRPQRVAELVAGRLRDRILRGEMHDGDLLPKEDELREEFPVSKPSMREALRILETEGLVTVRRGNQGGAVVHRPTASDAAYTLAIVLSGQRVSIDDVAASLREVEPACAALCAGRPDRDEAVVPPLRRLYDESLAAVEDLVAVTVLSRRFHETLVELCG